uniref:Protein kinase domain-containing protein n=1 Tax=Ananas comosus var. bracteatus TaxID=296719 RepID=A0A6V7PPP1_ANACO|nr:unnamed protein product [Ananas comosus var. bracteatus]
MGDSADLVLEFLRKNRFTKAEAALRVELDSRSDLNGVLEKQNPEAGEEIGWLVGLLIMDNGSIEEKFTELLLSEEPKHRRNGRGKVKGVLELDINQNSGFTANNSEKGCSVKTVFPFPDVSASASSSDDQVLGHGDDRNDVKKKEEFNDIREERSEHLNIAQSNNLRSFDLPLIGERQREDLPRLPPVRIKSEDKLVNMHWEDKVDRDGSGVKLCSADNTFMIGPFLDAPAGQDMSASGGKRTIGTSWLSVSQGIAEDTSDLVSGFATVGDESIDYPNEYWDSDEYDDDEDIGYTRQPIEDEAWFLAHEIDYPSDNEKGTGHSSGFEQPDRLQTKDEDDDQSFAEDSYLSGEQYCREKNIELMASSEVPIIDENCLIAQYDGQLMDIEELTLMRGEPVWEGFVTQSDELVLLGNGNVLDDSEQARVNGPLLGGDQHDSVRSIGVGMNSDAADISSEACESLVGGDIEYVHDSNVGKTSKTNLNSSKKENVKVTKQDQDNYILASEKGIFPTGTSSLDGGFSFLPPLSTGDIANADSGKSLWSEEGNVFVSDDADEHANGMGTDDMLAAWRRKSSDSSPVRSSRDAKTSDVNRSRDSTASSASDYAFAETKDIEKLRDHKIDGAQDDAVANLEDEEVAALQEQVRQIKAQVEEFETFNLKIVHRKNRTGFEEDKNFHVVLNSVIAGRYHVTEYLGSAAFSKAIQAHDLHTGMDVCVKIIKNNKDFFDQSLDEIKLLKYVNKHDPADKYHILRLYDYFYYREHLLIVCELLKANLYEFHKFNRESGGEVYFTMPRLQSITIQCLEALQFLHGLGLIHCDLKPENILVKSYSRCEVKVIDLGSSCFETDHLCSYVQSRSYRAPEVILGLPYDKKIDIWSLGCILAELCTGNVLFQNDSPATLLARVIGIIGPIEQGMLAKGRDTYKYFTKNHMLYERNQARILDPKKTSLRHRLPMADQGFIEFVTFLLEINPKKRPSASEALKHPWLSYPYEPISS